MRRTLGLVASLTVSLWAPAWAQTAPVADDSNDPAHWHWPAMAQDPALQQSIINGHYSAEELRNIHTELNILSGVTAQRASETQRGDSRAESPQRPVAGGRPAGGAMPSYMTPDVVFRGRTFALLGQLYGEAGKSSAPGYSVESISDRTNQVTDLIAKGDRVWITWMIAGRHTGTLFGFPATGKPLQIREIVMLRFRDGKIAEIETHTDDLSLYVQAGGKLEFPKP